MTRKGELESEGPEDISAPLLTWYDAHARELPWRVSPADRRAGVVPDPYAVWLSEIMLQQTTVATVTPRYQAFLDRWPRVTDMAAAPVEDVLHEWAGLGYYARARNLHKCAVVVAADHRGQFPQTEEALLALPGIGPYTAAAIAAIAFDQPAVVMDGNIERVMARLFAVEDPVPDAKPVLKAHAAALTPATRPGDHAQALMDLGATICTPRNPVCSLCPLNESCVGYATGKTDDLPRKAAKKPKPTRQGTAFVLRRRGDGAVFLVRRPGKGLLGGMPAFPATSWSEAMPPEGPPVDGAWRALAEPVRHTFTHFHLLLSVQTLTVDQVPDGLPDGQWVADPGEAGLPTVFAKVWDVVRE